MLDPTLDPTIDRLREIIAGQLDVNLSLAEIDPDTPLFESGLGLDSIALMELITLIEENFAFQLAESELTMEPFQNLRTLAQFVTQKLQPQSS